MRRSYGRFGKHLEIMDRYEAWRDLKMGLAESSEGKGENPVALGSGAPEGRADFPMFLLSQIHYNLVAAYQRREAQWSKYMGVEQAQDFRPHTRSALNSITGMGPVREYGEFPRGRSSEEALPSYAVGKYGLEYGVTFEMIVNDQADIILNRTPGELGRMVAAYVAKSCTALIESNPNYIDGKPFFTTEAREGLPSGNQKVGEEATPTEDNLVAIVEAMTNTTDPEGYPIQIDPNAILTRSEANRLIFKRIFRSQETSSMDTNMAPSHFPRGTANPLAGDTLIPQEVIVDKYLSNETNWMVIANTGRAPWVIAYYLNQRQPYIGIKDSMVRSATGGEADPYDFDTDEIWFKVRLLFGVALGDPRSAWQAVNS